MISSKPAAAGVWEANWTVWSTSLNCLPGLFRPANPPRRQTPELCVAKVVVVEEEVVRRGGGPSDLEEGEHIWKKVHWPQ